MALTLQDYLDEQLSSGKPRSILFSTDLELDDILAIMMLAAKLKDEVSAVNLTFLVGEGHSGKKLLRIQKMIDLMRNQGEIGSNIHIHFIQGYGSKKDFKLDGLELFTQEEIDRALEENKLSNGLTEEGRRQSLSKLKDHFEKFPETYVFGTKLPREFIDLANNEETARLLKNANYTGSFNFNYSALLSDKTHQDRMAALKIQMVTPENIESANAVALAQAPLFRFLSAWKSPVSYFEPSFCVGARNHFSYRELAPLFEKIKKTALGESYFRLLKNKTISTLGNIPDEIVMHAFKVPAASVAAMLACINTHALGLRKESCQIRFLQVQSADSLDHLIKAPSAHVFIPMDIPKDIFIRYSKLMAEKIMHEEVLKDNNHPQLNRSIVWLDSITQQLLSFTKIPSAQADIFAHCAEIIDKNLGSLIYAKVENQTVNLAAGGACALYLDVINWALSLMNTRISAQAAALGLVVSVANFMRTPYANAQDRDDGLWRVINRVIGSASPSACLNTAYQTMTKVSTQVADQYQKLVPQISRLKEVVKLR